MRDGSKWVRHAWGCPRCGKVEPKLWRDFQKRSRKAENDQLQKNLAAVIS